MKKDVYRKAALERLANADQLDKVMKITSPLSWIALAGVTFIIVMAIIWSFQDGALPSTVTVYHSKIVSSSTATNTLLANVEGTVEFKVKEGQLIKIGEVYAEITSSNGNKIECKSDQLCWVSSIIPHDGDKVSPGKELIRISPVPRDNQKHVIVCFVPKADIGKIKYGMKATITPDESSYGHMEGMIINIDTEITTNEGIEAVVGSDNGMVNQITKDGGVCAVTLEPLPAGLNPSSRKNDYWWSNNKGYKLELDSKTEFTVRIRTSSEDPASERPITRLFTVLKDIWGGNNEKV